MNITKETSRPALVLLAAMALAPLALQAGSAEQTAQQTQEAIRQAAANTREAVANSAQSAQNAASNVNASVNAGMQGAANGVAGAVNTTGNVTSNVADGVRGSVNSAAQAGAQTADGAMNGALDTENRLDVNRDGVNAASRTESSLAVRTDRVAIDLNRSDAVNIRLQTDTVTDSVEKAAFAVRDQAVALARRGAEDGRDIAASIRDGSRALAAEARADLNAAIAKTEQARDRLDQAIAEASAATEARWDDVRDELAERYEKYADALEDVREDAVDAGVKFETQITASGEARARG